MSEKFGLTVCYECIFISSSGRTDDKKAWHEKIKDYKKRFPKAEFVLFSLPGSEKKTEMTIIRKYADTKRDCNKCAHCGEAIDVSKNVDFCDECEAKMHPENPIEELEENEMDDNTWHNMLDGGGDVDGLD